MWRNFTEVMKKKWVIIKEWERRHEEVHGPNMLGEEVRAAMKEV